MTQEMGRDITLTGKTGQIYRGRIYDRNNLGSTIGAPAIVALSNSSEGEEGWQHQISDVFGASDIEATLQSFKERDDRSHLILIPLTEQQTTAGDPYADLVQQYVHK